MKLLFKFTALLLLTGAIGYISCKKEYSCENCPVVNKPPIANAGRDTTIVLPIDSVNLDGSASADPDGSISNFEWIKISGPASFSINNGSVAKTIVKNLVAGTYQFELKVTDNSGLSAKDTMQIIVNDPAQSNRPPVANAGANQTITLPTNKVNLDGSGSTDPDNNIASYAWVKISGPAAFSISNTNDVQIQIINLVQGVYLFELKVMDVSGLFSKDTVQITVNGIASTRCDISTRPVITAQLAPFGTLSASRTGITVASAGNKILFAGGDAGGGEPSTRVDIYDMVNQTWSTAELSISRWNMTAITSGNKIFFAGGYTNLQNSWDLFSNVDIYDASTNTWSIAQLSERRMGLAAAVVGNKIFFAGGLGGQAGSPPSNVSNKVDIYDISNNTWSTTILSEPRASLSAVTIGSKIYFAGGNTKNGTYGSSCDPSGRVDIYDNTTGLWSLSNMNETKAVNAAIGVGDKIFWAGGLNYNCSNDYTLSPDVEIRDVSTQTSSFACLFQPNAQFKAFVKDDKIVFFTGQGNVKNKFDIYDGTNNSWLIGTVSLNFQNVATSIISIANTIYVAEWDKVWKLEF